MAELTEKQKELLLMLGSPDDGSVDYPPAPKETIDELIVMGLLYKRPDNNFDLTDSGEAMYKKLGGKSGYWD